jgi:hypothetical protein
MLKQIDITAHWTVGASFEANAPSCALNYGAYPVITG